jgi:hypothetical protein
MRWVAAVESRGRARSTNVAPSSAEENERQENALDPDFDANWGEIEPDHEWFVTRFLSLVPPDGRALDAACGTGKYFGIVLASGRSVLGVDHTGATYHHVLARALDASRERSD